MKRLFAIVALGGWFLFALAGCSALSWLMGTTPETKDAPPINTVIGFLTTIPGIGSLIAAGLGAARWGWVEVSHAKLIKAGKKDNNNNGVDDALETPASTT